LFRSSHRRLCAATEALMASSDRIDELKKKFDENPRRYFAPLANEFRKGGDLEQAIAICEAHLPQQPGHMSGHIVYGQALFESGRLDESRTVFETALSLDPENLIALRHLGDIAGRQGDPSTARRWYERVLEADPRNDEIQGLIAGLSDARAEEVQTTATLAIEYADSTTSASLYAESTADAPPAPRDVAPPAVEPDLLDLDVMIPRDASSVTERWSEAEASSRETFAGPEGGEFDPTTFGEFEATSDTDELMPDGLARADGFEATEFAAPEAPVEPTMGLQSAFEDETGIHGAGIAPLPGLDRPRDEVDEAAAISEDAGFPELREELDEDEGLVLPPHGDPIAETTPEPSVASRDDSLLDFEMPVAASEAPGESAAATPHAPTDSLPFEDAASSDEFVLPASSSSDSIPPELPPEVIAAEAELIDAGMSVEQPPEAAAPSEDLDTESVGSELAFIDTGESTTAPSAAAGVGDSAEPVRADQRPFVTETMAELYLKQGFREEALSVYQQLSTSSPADDRLSSKVDALRADLASASKQAAGPPVREFFARFASRRPGERAVSAAPPMESDFASEDEAPVAASAADAPEPGTATASSAPVAETPGTTPTGGSIDALFGHRPIGTSEDSAASALAQAFGGAPETPQITGRPARPASGELTLDSVFREGGARGPRTSQGFSFDQFFSQSVEGDRTSGGRTSQEVPAPGEPAERTEDDIEQFNSWLQGLKQR
jgi:tetratricopeptide (TPR) repeat protein